MSFSKRYLTVIVGLSITISIVVFAPPVLFCIAVCAVAFIALIEFLQMYQINGDPGLYRGVLAIVIIVSLLSFFSGFTTVWQAWALVPLLVLVVALVTQKVNDNGMRQVAIAVLGVVYISCFSSFFWLIRALPHGRELVIVTLIGTWAGDIGAFILGNTLQKKHIISPQLNPRKSFEAAIGGSLVAAAISLILGWRLLPSGSFFDLLGISVLIGSGGQIGDLVESWIKRNAGATDSGHILPEEGGMLDSIDGLIFTAPAVYGYVMIM